MVARTIDITIGEVRRTPRHNFVNDHVLRLKAAHAEFPISADQISAWETLCCWLSDAASTLSDKFDSVGCLFEFSPPMKSERSDLILTSEKEIFVIEAKTGHSHSKHQAQKQALGYAYEIYNSLLVGAERKVIPIVLQDRPIRADGHKASHIVDHDYEAKSVAVIAAGDLANQIAQMTPPRPSTDLLDVSRWMHQPRASIVNLAQEMFGNLRTGEVIKALANPDEIDRLIVRIREIIAQAKTNSEHRVIAISGRPGSGKTLVGLRITHQTSLPHLMGPDSNAPIYLSGNGPLVKVIQEAIARSYKTSMSKYASDDVNIEKARAVAKEIILEVRGVESDTFSIASNVIIFDEAQRAWTAKRMQTKRKNRALGSQPYEILKKMSQKSWAVVICLVGTGQHINQGEEGMDTWYEAVGLNPKLPSSTPRTTWRISVQHNEKKEGSFIDRASDLELTVDMRAGSTRMNEWVNLLLKHQIDEARSCRSEFPSFPLHVCRDLKVSTEWLRNSTDIDHGETAGLLASSGGERLNCYGIRVAGAEDFPAVNWYLEKPPHLDSSSSFDIAATEYGCQGLDLDRVCVCWSWDLLARDGAWTPRKLNRRTARWSAVKSKNQMEYVQNAYRVLLTRSRAGMVIWVPHGDKTDASRPSRDVDAIYETLIAAGCEPISK